MAVVIDGGKGLSAEKDIWVTAGLTAVADGADLVDANDLGTAAYAAAGDFDAAGSARTVQSAGLAYEFLSIIYDNTYTDAPSVATVKWYDGSSGTWTATSINTTWGLVDAYTVTHNDSGLTYTQSSVTRNSDGYITVKPAITVA